jgi:hypothetical protein
MKTELMVENVKIFTFGTQTSYFSQKKSLETTQNYLARKTLFHFKYHFGKKSFDLTRCLWFWFNGISKLNNI